jgi:hypothetical protein
MQPMKRLATAAAAFTSMAAFADCTMVPITICTATTRGPSCTTTTVMQCTSPGPAVPLPTAPPVFCEVRILYPNNKPSDVMVEIPVSPLCDQGGAEAAISTYLQQLLNGAKTLPH